MKLLSATALAISVALWAGLATGSVSWPAAVFATVYLAVALAWFELVGPGGRGVGD